MALHEQRDPKDSRSTTTEVRAQDKPSREPARAAHESSPRESGLRSWSDPFDALRRFTDRLDRWPLAPFWGPPAETATRRRGLAGLWAPQIESFQRGDQFVVRADLPGLTKDDIRVELEDDALVIAGERTTEEEHDDDGFYSSERSYGRFCRVVPLPDGAIQDSAKASFNNGVLEVTLHASPRETPRGRRLEISGGERTGR
jgi:HSP20 family protein